VRGRNGRWYLVRIMPYRTLANVIDGVVVTFIDITVQKQTQEELRESLAFAEAIVETVREPLVVLDGELRVMRANEAFYKTFGVSPELPRKRLSSNSAIASGISRRSGKSLTYPARKRACP